MASGAACMEIARVLWRPATIKSSPGRAASRSSGAAPKQASGGYLSKAYAAPLAITAPALTTAVVSGLYFVPMSEPPRPPTLIAPVATDPGAELSERTAGQREDGDDRHTHSGPGG